MLNITKSTVRAIIKKHNSQGHVTNVIGCGRKSTLSTRADRNVHRYFNKKVRVTAKKVVKVQGISGVNVS